MKTFFLSGALLLSVLSLRAQYDSLDANHIHAGFNASGDLFYNINTGNGHFATPGNKVSYAIGNLWIGGLDAGGQLKLAAQTYRQTGTDFWPGPLDTTIAVCDTAASHAYNQVWKVRCAQVDSFIGFMQNPTAYPGYTVPSVIQTWPGSGHTQFGQSIYLAPYYDSNGNGYYEYAAGDYPLVRGTQSLFYIYNDNLQGQTHTETNAPSIGVEVQAMAYEFEYPWSDALMNTVFIHYTIINHSTQALQHSKIGFWSDFNLVNGTRVGSDSLLGAYYYYAQNAAAGVVFLNSPMNGCIGYDNTFSVSGNPANSAHYYNYMNQDWKDGSPLTTGGNGYGGSNASHWMYNGDPDAGTGWLDATNGDTRMVGTTADSVFLPGQRYTFDIAIVYANDTASSFSAVTKMKQYMQQVKAFSQQSPVCTAAFTGIHENQAANSVSVFPNPASDQLSIQTADAKAQSFLILDATGRVVLSGTTSGTKTDVNIQQLSAGMYFLQLGNPGQLQTLKFVKTVE